ncbi:hypothetical protein [Arthrobacter russicus]|uniref:ParB/Sulfiredoxin domain-containing protein n=1 Tax=Arthrobacter russicus TaxID=172040 RepID=A0ABU1JCH6_9MICC|nr:hypothetical protein [Arthrobacter russicus]MDR6269849.1 hypothetical protein [Arthrobacter russicus]
MNQVKWLAEPEAQDYPAAANYLNLLADQDLAAGLIAGLRAASISQQKAKDLLRASGLPLLPEDNPHVASDLAKIRHGKALSPVLVVRGDLVRGVPAQIADGYHRVCASYWTDENTDIPVKLVDFH